MVHPEVQLISAVLQNRDLASARKAGCLPTHMGEPQCRAAYEYLLRFDEEHPGEVPDVEMFLRRSGFPDYVEIEGHLSVEALACEIIKLSKSREIEQIVPSHAEIAQDPDKALQDLLGKARDVSMAHGRHTIVPLTDSMTQLRAMAGSGQGFIRGMPYPWKGLTDASLGMAPKELIVFYGRAGSYKTWSLYTTAYCIVHECHSAQVMIYSPEMDEEETRRMFGTIITGIPYHEIRANKLDEEKLSQLTMSVDDFLSATKDGRLGRLHISYPDDDMHIEELLRQVEIIKPDILLVDSIYLLEAIENCDTRDKRNLAKIMKILRQLAKRKNMPIVAVFQASRKKNDQTGVHMGADDLFGADAVSQDCDTSLRFYKFVDDDNVTKALIQITKSRHFDCGGLIVKPPPSGSYEQLELLNTSAEVDKQLTKLANRGKTPRTAKLPDKKLNLDMGSY